MKALGPGDSQRNHKSRKCTMTHKIGWKREIDLDLAIDGIQGWVTFLLRRLSQWHKNHMGTTWGSTRSPCGKLDDMVRTKRLVLIGHIFRSASEIDVNFFTIGKVSRRQTQR